MPPKKKPFSNKQKKVQLQLKKYKKKDKVPFGASPPRPRPIPSSDSDSEEEGGVATSDHVIVPRKPHCQAVQTVIKRYDPNRFKLHFHQESNAEIEKRKLNAKRIPINRIPEESLEVGVDDVYRLGSELDIPCRPPWDYSMSKEEVQRREEEMFSKYVQNIFSKHSPQKLSYFELNLETWRQLWRVLEISDLVLLITDIRHPALHFSPALYKHVVEELKKPIVLVLNKVDLVPPQVVVAWKHYFMTTFPELLITCFSSFPNKDASLDTVDKVKFKLSRRGAFKSALGPSELCTIVERVCQQDESKVDVSSWKRKLSLCDKDAKGDGPPGPAPTVATNSNQNKDDSILTIGLVGHPNVGKSSLLNGLMEKKTVSTSRTPGHTKHFQTIFLSPHIRLCDCPGLVFPSVVSKQLQILSGMYPIAQVKEPYSVVGYLAQCIPLVRLLSLSHPDPSPLTSDLSWTPWDICDAWAEKRGYYTRKSGKPDTYRAANNILRLAADGRICLYFRPPGYHSNKAHWDAHPEVQEMIRLQTMGGASKEWVEPESSDTSSDECESSDEEIFITENKTKFSALMNFSDTSD